MNLAPTEHQKEKVQELLEWWNLPAGHIDYLNCILTGAAGSGKAQPLTEPVLTPEGFIPMGSIEEGDFVISEEGLPIQVLKTFSHKALRMYEVKFSDGSRSICCEDHLWEVYPKFIRKHNGKEVLTLKAMLPKIQVSKTPKQAYAYRVPLVKPITGKLEPSLLHCYTFGYALGNGSSSKLNRSAALVLTMAQEDFPEIVRKIPEKYILSVTEEKNNTNVSLIALNEEFRSFYNSFALRGVTSTCKYIPDTFFTASIQQRVSLLKGLCDSDGSCRNNKARFHTSSLRLAEGFVSLVRSLGGVASLSNNVRSDKGVEANTEYGVCFRTPFNPFSLERKAVEYTTLPTDVEGKKSIVSATFIGVQDGKCLLVDSATHLYVTRDYTVTHNTFVTEYVLSQLSSAIPLRTGTTNESVHQMELAGNAAAMTCHKALNLKRVTNCEIPYFALDTRAETSPLDGKNLLVIDESSMAGKAGMGGTKSDEDEHSQIIDYVYEKNVRTLWIGDRYQLPPVGAAQGKSPIFHEGHRTVELTEVMRNTGDILTACTMLRQCVDMKVRRLPTKFPVPTVTSKELYDACANSSSLGDAILHQDLVILCWRNSVVDQLNQKIRLNLNGGIASKQLVLVGDRLLFTSPLLVGQFPDEPEDLLQKSVKKELKIAGKVNARATVQKVSEGELFGVECYKAMLKLDNGATEVAYIPTKQGSLQLKKLLEEYAGRAKAGNTRWWQVRNAVSDCFLDVKYDYCITVHRAQGMTRKQVIVNLPDIISNRDQALAYRMAYTAASRSSEKLILVRG
jgi:hypothetical protein